LRVKQNLTVSPYGIVADSRGVKWKPGRQQGVAMEAVPGGLIMPEGQEIEEICVEDSLVSDVFFKNQEDQEGRTSGLRLIATCQAQGVGRWNSRWRKGLKKVVKAGLRA
jgi:hypothetical protein